MPAIKVSKLLPEKHVLNLSDPTGGTHVIVQPPTPGAIHERAQELSKRTPTFIEGYYHTQVDVNTERLRHLEIWLTYHDTNLEVQVTDEDGEIAETITFKPREQTTRREFMASLNRLAAVAYGILIEWQQKVRETVPQWDTPFW